MAYYRVEPFGEDRADIRSAQLANLIFHAWYKGDKDISDFMLFSEKPGQPDDIQMAMAQYNNDSIRAKHGVG